MVFEQLTKNRLSNFYDYRLPYLRNGENDWVILET